MAYANVRDVKVVAVEHGATVGEMLLALFGQELGAGRAPWPSCSLRSNWCFIATGSSVVGRSGAAISARSPKYLPDLVSGQSRDQAASCSYASLSATCRPPTLAESAERAVANGRSLRVHKSSGWKIHQC